MSSTDHHHHPYFPQTAPIVGYVANEMSTPQLLAAFAAGTSAVLFASMVAAKCANGRLTKGQVGSVMWFVLCKFRRRRRRRGRGRRGRRNNGKTTRA